MIAAKDLTPSELAALLHFHADAGVDWLLEEEAVDRFAEFETMKAARQQSRTPQPRDDAGAPSGRAAPPEVRTRTPQAAPTAAPTRST